MNPLTIGKPLIHLPLVDSTNNYASALLKNQEVVEGTAILADCQTMGKGYAGNTWLSEANSNLLFSIILRPDFLLAEKQFYLSMCISNGILENLGTMIERLSIKWPNDILLNNRKVAGILIENTIQGRYLNTSVIGVGLNVNQQVFPPEIPDAISLQLATGKAYALPELLTPLLQSLSSQVNRLYKEDYAEIRRTYLNKLKGLQEWAWYSDITGRFEGKMVDISDSGELMVIRRNGILKQYGFKEIQFEVDSFMR